MKKIISLLTICALLLSTMMVVHAKESTNTGLGLSDEDKASYKETGFDFDDYEAYLADNKIAVVDGNISIETADQFSAITKYYFDYLSVYDCTTDEIEKPPKRKVNLRRVADYIVAMNIAFIPASVLQDLVNEDLVSSPFTFFNEYWHATNAIGGALRSFAESNSTNEFITNLPIIFNANIRQCVAYLEKELRSFIMNPLKTHDSMDVALDYIKVFMEFASFWTETDDDDYIFHSNYPTELSKLDPSARCVFSILYCEMEYVAIESRVTPGDFTRIYYDFHDKEDHSLVSKSYVQLYLDSFPTKTID